MQSGELYYPLFQDPRWGDVTLVIVGLCVVGYIWVLMRHANRYTDPLIQRSLARIPGVLPVFAIMAHIKWVHPTQDVSLGVEIMAAVLDAFVLIWFFEYLLARLGGRDVVRVLFDLPNGCPPLRATIEISSLTASFSSPR